MNTDLLIQGAELMLLGMGIVFGFLTVLVFTLRGMSLLADRLHQPEQVHPELPPPIDVSDHRQVIAAIAVAVSRYRATHGA
ncbi:MAG: OadG family protein [Gammaproteobacteria bacterium]|nr:OadG family protein [Gammaproteobacteria bacterium]